MIVLFVGDVVGRPATEWLVERIPQLRRKHDAGLVVVNAENSGEDGFGPTCAMVDMLHDAGADVVTGGNHSWDSPDAVAALNRPWVLRPLNFAPGVPGIGILTVQVGGDPVTVVNLGDQCAMRSARGVAHKFMPAFPCWLTADRTGTVLVDYHGEHVIEKQIFAHTVDGTAAAVLGTHTHEPTLPLRILPSGTALVTDVGMTGPTGGVQGFTAANFVTGLTREGNPFHPPLPVPADGPLTLGAVLVEVEGGKATRLERLT